MKAVKILAAVIIVLGLSACHGHLHVPPGQVNKHATPGHINKW
jgi:hypothetical protein